MIENMSIIEKIKFYKTSEEAQKYVNIVGFGEISPYDIGLNSLTMTDKDLEQFRSFSRIEKFILCDCINITDEGLKNLGNVVDIYLKNCYQITDAGLEYLKRARKVNIDGCQNITDTGLYNLCVDWSFEFARGKIKEISMEGLNHVTNKGLEYLCCVDSYDGKGLKKINLSYCDWVDDESLRILQRVKEIKLIQCNKVTDVGISYLKNVRKINLAGCNSVTDKGLKHLGKIKKGEFTGCDIGDKGILALLYYRKKRKPIEEITLYNCRVSLAGLKYLHEVKAIYTNRGVGDTKKPSNIKRLD